MAKINKKQLSNIIDKTIATELSEKERGQIYTNFTQLYLRTLNDFSKRYERFLDDAKIILSRINESEEKLK